MTGSDRAMSEDDEIVQEVRRARRGAPSDAVQLDIYYTPTLAKTLTLLQFPHRTLARAPHHQRDHPLVPRSVQRSDTVDTSIKARLKPATSTLEVSTPLEEIHSGRLSKSKANEYGAAVTEADLNGGKSSTSGEKPALQSIVWRGQAVPDQTNYVAAVLVNGQVHLTPLPSTVQVRPHLGYIDRQKTAKAKAEKDAATAAEAENDSDDHAAASDPEETETAFDRRKKSNLNGGNEPRAAQVTIKQDSLSSAAAKAARNTPSLLTPLRAQEQEQWTELEFSDQSVSTAAAVAAKLIAPTDADPLDCVLQAHRHLLVDTVLSDLPMKPV